MLAVSPDAALPWATFMGAAVLLLVIAALALDRALSHRRLAEAERHAALLATDLDAARREIATMQTWLTPATPGSRPAVAAPPAATGPDVVSAPPASAA